MSTKVPNQDFVPATGSANLAKYLRDDGDDLRALKTDSDLDRHIVQLLALHSSLRLRFRNQDLTTLDDATKRALLKDMNQVLGIKPLKIPGR
jgi:hypothetical protein